MWWIKTKNKTKQKKNSETFPHLDNRGKKNTHLNIILRAGANG